MALPLCMVDDACRKDTLRPEKEPVRKVVNAQPHQNKPKCRAAKNGEHKEEDYKGKSSNYLSLRLEYGFVSHLPILPAHLRWSTSRDGWYEPEPTIQEEMRLETLTIETTTIQAIGVANMATKNRGLRKTGRSDFANTKPTQRATM